MATIDLSGFSALFEATINSASMIIPLIVITISTVIITRDVQKMGMLVFPIALGWRIAGLDVHMIILLATGFWFLVSGLNTQILGQALKLITKIPTPFGGNKMELPKNIKYGGVITPEQYQKEALKHAKGYVDLADISPSALQEKKLYVAKQQDQIMHEGEQRRSKTKMMEQEIYETRQQEQQEKRKLLDKINRAKNEAHRRLTFIATDQKKVADRLNRINRVLKDSVHKISYWSDSYLLSIRQERESLLKRKDYLNKKEKELQTITLS